MAAMQKHFMKENAELFEEASLDVNKSNDRDSNINLSECSQKTPVAVGIGQPARMSEEETYKTCILCQENQSCNSDWTSNGISCICSAIYSYCVKIELH